MMRRILLPIALLISLATLAQEARINVTASRYVGQPVLLYRYDDLFTLRTSRITGALIGDDGKASLASPVSGTGKLRLRIGEVFADLYARPNATYTVEFLPPAPGTARSLGGTTRTSLLFHDLDPLDVNALTSDLNARIDGFVSEDLATDQAAGMQAVGVQRKEAGAPADSVRRPPTLFVMPTWSKARVDSFERKVRHFYREVEDPWFAHFLNSSFAGLRHGPRVNEAEQFEAYVKGRAVVYDDPELVRFLRTFYAEHLLLAQQTDAGALARAFERGDADSLRALLARNDFLKDDDRRCELVMIDLLYQQYNGKIVQRTGADAMLKSVSERSIYPEHRVIAANMLWDLTAMRVGERFPPMRLEDLRGRDVALDSLLNGAVCVVFTASWCSYCDLEMQGMEQLHAEYKSLVPIIAISLDHDPDALRKYVMAHPGMDFRWLRAQAEQQLRDDLRIRSLPAVYLLNDGILAHSPAPLPSRGLGAHFHRARVEAEKGSRLKVWDD